MRAGRTWPIRLRRGRSSGVEHNLAKVGVEGSNPFARSNYVKYLDGRTTAVIRQRYQIGTAGGPETRSSRKPGGPLPRSSRAVQLGRNGRLACCPTIGARAGYWENRAGRGGRVEIYTRRAGPRQDQCLVSVEIEEAIAVQEPQEPRSIDPRKWPIAVAAEQIMGSPAKHRCDRAEPAIEGPAHVVDKALPRPAHQRCREQPLLS
jgi:hypothetical protein